MTNQEVLALFAPTQVEYCVFDVLDSTATHSVPIAVVVAPLLSPSQYKSRLPKAARGLKKMGHPFRYVRRSSPMSLSAARAERRERIKMLECATGLTVWN